MTYAVRLSPAARRALEERLPESVAAAAWEFITGALADNPRRVGKPLMGELEGLWSARRGAYRVVYSIDEGVVTIVIMRVSHRADAYR